MNRSKGWRRALLLGAVSLLGIAPGFAAAGERSQGGEGSPGGIKPDLLYHNYCSVCHGDRGDGRSRARNSLVPPPRDFTTAQGLTHDYMVKIVADGKPGTAMVGWKTQLNEREISALVTYVESTFMNGAPFAAAKGVSGINAHGGRERDAKPVAAAAPAAATATAADMSLPLPSGLSGDARKGRQFYNGNCATCHGEKGDGQGPRAYFIRPVPRNFLEDAPRATLNRPALYAAVSAGRLGTEMPAWSKVLSNQEIADVVEYVFQQFIRPQAKTAAKGK